MAEPTAGRERLETLEDDMRSGLLWFDDSPGVPLASKIEKAMQRYQERVGRSPNVCYVHPKTLVGADGMRPPVKVVESTTIQPNCFLVGFRRRSR
jgi:hypothetical protein